MKKRWMLISILVIAAFSAVSCKKTQDAADASVQAEVPQDTDSGKEEGGITVEESVSIEVGSDEEGALAPE